MRRLSNKRHIVKAITWRAVGTIDTIILSWIISGNISDGLKIGGLELFTKILLYYLHERAWYKFVRAEKIKSTIRHILKTITWRFIGSLDTAILGTLITNDVKKGAALALAEVITKTILYFFHERIWYRSNYGLMKSQG